ncbi:transcriptional repressor [Echinicola pacifica]|uniref:Transcriptional repressor n=1 Tax=Echinicola pacifica TaxID=346377 RepID=A0A918URR7_9BACT|nr:transcriptional repressor [Echinicola pacifica]GGZ29446.1 transcriptional repressor [Echinicola pacifica]
MTTEQTREILSKGGLKFTHQRMVIYGAVSCTHNHPTAEWVYEQIKSDNPSISLGTVYKTLDTFVNAGIIQKFVDNKGVMRFDGILEAHSHLYDNETNEIRDYRNEKLERLIKEFFAENQISGFEVEDISVVIKGHNK